MNGEELYKDLLIIYESAKYNDEFFNPEYYKWELGSEVLTSLLGAISNYPHIQRNLYKTLFGIEIKENVTDKKIKKLWKDVTMEV